MHRRYERMGFTNGEENQDTTNKAKWKIIDTRQQLEGNYGREEIREIEATIGCNILNRFLDLGTATSERVAQSRRP